MAAPLETVDLVGVEILSTGGPVFGKGSPPEGDFWTEDDLRAMAEADAELGDEIKPPAKIGHSDAQRLLGLTDGEMPAVGWIENVRLNNDGSKLIADLLKVPRKFAELVKAGGYRTRSVELSKVTSQETGKVYEWVVTGLAWLGGKLPAVKTLDDVVALYEDRGVDLPELQRVVIYEQPADGTVVWRPETSLQAIRNDLQEALNPNGMDMSMALWVCDVSSDGVALVSQGYDDGDAFVVPFTVGGDGTVTAAPVSEWVHAEKTWVATSKAYQDAGRQPVPGSSGGAADTGAMKFTDEQKRKFAEAAGIEPDKATDEMLEAAGVTADAEPETQPDERALEAEVKETRSELADVKRELAEERETARVDRRRSFVDDLLKDGKIEPGQREHAERHFDKDEEGARAFYATVKPNQDLAREYGAEAGDETTEQTEFERAYEADMAARHRVKAEELI